LYNFSTFKKTLPENMPSFSGHLHFVCRIFSPIRRLSSAMGAASPPLVLDVGAYCGGSALRLAGCLPGTPLFPVYRRVFP